MKLTILEFAPCADSIYHLRRDAEEGYVAGDGREVRIRSGAKLRPRRVSDYAGGKATNVARVVERLLKPGDAVEAELVVFRPDSPLGRYIHELQSEALRRVAVRPVLIQGGARLCLDLTDPETDPDDRVQFNISPRAVWQAGALPVAERFIETLSADVLLIAGNPPLVGPAEEMAESLYAGIIERLRRRVRVISVDTEKGALARCLEAGAHPDVIKINDREHQSVPAPAWARFAGTLVVTDAAGCWLREGGGPPARVRGAAVERLFSTIGAGDAFHAGFTVARWVWGWDAERAARYGHAAAAAAVGSPSGTREVSSSEVESVFHRLQQEAGQEN